jgi:hypothetical protein
LLPFVTMLSASYAPSGGPGKNPEFRRLSTPVLVTLHSGTLFYRRVEGWGFLDSVYFSVVTTTTVSYGDLSPSTATGKVFTSCTSLWG